MVNQVGYLPAGPKRATVVTAATTPLMWRLRDAAGRTVTTGLTTERGIDRASGHNVQTIAFDTFRRPGRGYSLAVADKASYPFSIGRTIYDRLFADSMRFFYLQRSGIAIDASLAGAAYARPAGHLGLAPNRGDTEVPCQPGVCDYRQDVRGGWYDAGDHGKYVVNGGISGYQLLSAFERGTHVRDPGGIFGDGALSVPEHHDGVPDILNEARWEVEFLLRMQVPAGRPYAGMAHHKVHDNQWTALPTQPQDDPMPRELHQVSTAATLNLAAVAAQAARLFRPYDDTFANTCLHAARIAYTAAKTHANMIAAGDDNIGGGAYDDADVSDEFYWAAAELAITTAEPAYLADVVSSSHHDDDVFTREFSWGRTAALGRLDLATVPSLLPISERHLARASVAAAATRLLGTLNGQAYGLPLPATGYVWGSNSAVINNAIVIATAYDLTKDRRYRAGAVQAMDYVLGRNALNQSYVTGWGENSSHNQHTRIYAHELNPALPAPPVGSLAGGANPGLQDPYAAAHLAGCAPQLCYVDDIQSYSTNEIAINWNSALVWMAAFLSTAAQEP